MEGEAMAYTKVDHVGILVDDLEVGRHVFCDGMGLAVNEHRSPWPQGRTGTLDGTTSIEIPMGEMYIEISRPDDPASPAARFVAERRAGMYYIALASNDLPGDIWALQERGVTVEGDWDGEGAAFLEYGWGDRRFFKDSNFWPHAILAAALLPTDSVVYVRARSALPTTRPGGLTVHHRIVDGDSLRRLIVVLEKAMR